MRSFLCLLFLLGVLPAEAKPKARAPASFHIIILGGGQTPAEAQAALEKYTRGAHPGVTPVEGYPRLLESDEMAGLKPGFHIAVLGICPEVERARALRDLANLAMPGVYLREVHASVPDACPKLVLPKPKALKGHVHQGSYPVRAGVKGLSYEVHSRALDTGQTPCVESRLVVRLELGGRAVDEESWTGDCNPPVGEGDLGSSSEWSLEEALSFGERSFLLVKESASIADNTTHTWRLVGEACGDVDELFTVGSRLEFGPPGDVTVKAEGEGPEAWRKLVVRTTEGNCGENGEGEGCESSSRTFTWDDAACAYR
ncbi:hypothetical protein KYC5002_47290 [Archangium violaceum]|uniref:hypothetical protein n=1 Tax=Archangium violaceum TaxID=83451 RepID=UPI002B306D45|nr:hypothetical protein KYC5002_47290 [Archangium gephyra]